MDVHSDAIRSKVDTPKITLCVKASSLHAHLVHQYVPIVEETIIEHLVYQKTFEPS